MVDDEGQQPIDTLVLREPDLSKRAVSRRTMLTWLAGNISAEMLASGITWPTAVQGFQALFSAADSSRGQAGGQAFFYSSGWLSSNGNQGTADEFHIDLNAIPNPSAGKSYYAWLLDDGHKDQNPSPTASTFLWNRCYQPWWSKFRL